MPARSSSGIKSAPELANRRVTSDYIADALREAINSGTLADGEVLNQVAIAEQFGVSRVPVREAMRELQAEGLIQAATHRRAVVRALSLERLTEIFEVRALLEGFLIERAIPRVDPARIKRLRALEQKMMKTRDHAAWLKLNAKFHQELLETADAETAFEIVEQLRSRGERYTKMWSEGLGIDRAEEAGEEHCRILDAVEDGDVETARAETEAHVLHTRDRLLRLKDGDESSTEAEPAAAPKRAQRKSKSARNGKSAS